MAMAEHYIPKSTSDNVSETGKTDNPEKDENNISVTAKMDSPEKDENKISETAMDNYWVDEDVEGQAFGEIDGGSGLETKRRRQFNANEKTPLVGVDDAANEIRSAGEDIRETYFDDDEGTKDSSSDSSSLKSTESELFGTKMKSGNGNLTFTRDLQSDPNAGAKHYLNHMNVGNGLGSYVASVENGEGEIVATIDPKTTHTHNDIAKVVNLDISELEVEKVLEEQETHDLFCPNCNSCITKRIILRKRKRKVADFQHEGRPGKLHVRPCVIESSTVDIEETSHDEPDIFRCLSCFSFFIPTDHGFNIFRIFQKREETVTVQVPNIQSSGQTITRDGNWISSIFKSEPSKKKESESAKISPQLEVSFGGDHQLEENQRITNLPISVSVKTKESYKSNEKIYSAAQFPVKASSSGQRLPNKTKNVVAPTVSDIDNAGEGDGDIRPLIVSKPAISELGQINHDVQIISPAISELGQINHDLQIRSPAISELGQINHDVQIGSPATTLLPQGNDDNVPLNKPAISLDQINNDLQITSPATILLPQEDGTIKPVSIVESSTSSHGTSQKDLSITISGPPSAVFVPLGDVQINIGNEILGEPRSGYELEVLKSIVYGGLLESIASLGVVSSAAGAETKTLNIIAIGLANLVGGFFMILNDLSELKASAPTNQKDEPTSRYWKLLGRKSNFGLHATVAIISYILFGLLPPVIYGFSFRDRDNRENKLIMVAASSLLCIALLAIGKAHVSEPRSYIKAFLYYIGLGFTASGLSYVAGVLINRFLDYLGLFDHTAPLPSPPSIDLLGVGSGLSLWASG